jgi:thiamine kinase-like enzyme
VGRQGAARRAGARPQHHRPGRPRDGEALSGADAARARAERLACWRGKVAAEPLGGGLTNRNFTVVDRGERFVVRIGDDIPLHRVVRSAELAAQRAACAAGIAPEIVHAEPGALVMRHVDGRTLAAEDLRDGATIDRVAALLVRVHREVGRHLAGAPPDFAPFRLFAHYLGLLRAGDRADAATLADLAALAARLEAAVGAEPPAFCHNDLLPANLIDDGARLWLIDWEYAGLNAPLFDLANLAANAELDDDLARRLLGRHDGSPPDAARWRDFLAMRCVSLLRETLWSMVSEATSTLAVDYAAYTAENAARLARARGRFEAPGG